MTVKIHETHGSALSEALLTRWRHVPAAIIADVSDGACLVDPAIRPLRPAGQQPRLFGRAVTALCLPPDFGAVLWALDRVQAGEVLVIDAQGNAAHAMIGGILGGYLHRKKAAGVVCDGAVRDVAELAAMEGFSVFSRSVTPRGPTAVSQGEVNGAVRLGGLVVRPGDLVIGDDDGVVSLNAEAAAGLIGKAEAKLALEARWIKGLKAGQSVRDTFELQG